jgi:hypothetical protein
MTSDKQSVREFGDQLSLPGRRLAAAFASTLSAAAVLAVLTLSPQAMAQGRKAACPNPAVAHPGPVARACAQAGRKRRAHARPKVKRHHAKRGVGRNNGKRKRSKPSTVTGRFAAACEDASAPVRAGDGSFSCRDGSEPTCEDGSSPTLSSDGSTLVCEFGSPGGAGSAEAVCEDGSAPNPAGNGSFSCGDGSEPSCEDGSPPTPSSEGSALLCGVRARGKGAG